MTTEIRVSDIGDFKGVPVIEIHVAPGAVVKPEDPLITLESDKATMDVPPPQGGTVTEVRVNLGDRVSEGSVILTLEAEGAAVAAKEKVGCTPISCASSITLAACSSALDGMQPTLRQTPPSIGPAEEEGPLTITPAG